MKLNVDCGFRKWGMSYDSDTEYKSACLTITASRNPIKVKLDLWDFFDNDVDNLINFFVQIKADRLKAK